jgi:Xaa-Pro aminopeptidase
MQIRVKEIREAIAASPLFDAFLVTRPENIYYTVRFPGDDSCLLITPKRSYFITDKRNSDEAEFFFGRERQTSVIVADKGISKIALCKKLMVKSRVRRLGFEARHVSYAFATDLGKKLGEKKVIPINGFIEQFRIIKTAAELMTMKQAIALNEKTYGYLKKVLSASRTEVEMRNAVEARMRQLGADSPSFPTIIASGMRSAFPHARSTSERIAKDALLLADMGTRYQCYCSDLTRTFQVGRMPRFFCKIYDRVLTAQKIAIKAIKPGAQIREVVKEVQEYFRDHGLDRYFTHALGHGIGLEVHEAPLLHDKNCDVLRPGMVVTVEPGLYFPGRGGVRIEDMVLVTEKGAEVLSKYPTSLKMMKISN